MSDLLPKEGWLADWMDYGTRYMMAPREFVLASGIAALSTCVGRSVYVRLGARRWYPHVWLLLLAPAGARKSTPTHAAIDAVRRALGEEALLPRRWSPEGFYGALERRPDGLWDVGEIAGFLRSAGRDYMAGAREELCDVWDSRMITRALRKKSDSIKVESPAPTAIATGRATDFSEAAGLADFRSGFLSRFVLLSTEELGQYRGLRETTAGSDAFTSEERFRRLVEDLKVLTEPLREQPRGPASEDHLERPATFTDDAIDYWEDLDRRWQSENVPDELSGWSARRGIQSLKLAVLHAISRQGVPDVDVDDIDWGLAVVTQAFDWCALAVVESIGLDRASENRRYVWRQGLALRNGDASVNFREWMRSVDHRVNLKDFEAMIATWEESGRIAIAKLPPTGGGRGRPSRAVTFLSRLETGVNSLLKHEDINEDTGTK